MGLTATVEGLKGPWQHEEDKDLLKAVELWGCDPHSWRSVAEEFNKNRPSSRTRSMKQCRERYMLHLRPDISNKPWTHGEDLLIVEGHKQHGNKWQEIAKMLPGRTESSVKNHWNATLRRKYKFNDPAEDAPLRKYIRGLLEAEEEVLRHQPRVKKQRMVLTPSQRAAAASTVLGSGGNPLAQPVVDAPSGTFDAFWQDGAAAEGLPGPNLLATRGSMPLSWHRAPPQLDGIDTQDSSGPSSAPRMLPPGAIMHAGPFGGRPMVAISGMDAAAHAAAAAAAVQRQSIMQYGPLLVYSPRMAAAAAAMGQGVDGIGAHSPAHVLAERRSLQERHLREMYPDQDAGVASELPQGKAADADGTPGPTGEADELQQGLARVRVSPLEQRLGTPLSERTGSPLAVRRTAAGQPAENANPASSRTHTPRVALTSTGGPADAQHYVEHDITPGPGAIDHGGSSDIEDGAPAGYGITAAAGQGLQPGAGDEAPGTELDETPVHALTAEEGDHGYPAAVDAAGADGYNTWAAKRKSRLGQLDGAAWPASHHGPMMGMLQMPMAVGGGAHPYHLQLLLQRQALLQRMHGLPSGTAVALPTFMNGHVSQKQGHHTGIMACSLDAMGNPVMVPVMMHRASLHRGQPGAAYPYGGVSPAMAEDVEPVPEDDVQGGRNQIPPARVTQLPRRRPPGSMRDDDEYEEVAEQEGGWAPHSGRGMSRLRPGQLVYDSGRPRTPTASARAGAKRAWQPWTPAGGPADDGTGSLPVRMSARDSPLTQRGSGGSMGATRSARDSDGLRRSARPNKGSPRVRDVSPPSRNRTPRSERCALGAAAAQYREAWSDVEMSSRSMHGVPYADRYGADESGPTPRSRAGRRRPAANTWAVEHLNHYDNRHNPTESTGSQRRGHHPDLEVEAEADSLFSTLLAAAAAIECESQGESLKATAADNEACAAETATPANPAQLPHDTDAEVNATPPLTTAPNDPTTPAPTTTEDPTERQHRSRYLSQLPQLPHPSLRAVAVAGSDVSDAAGSDLDMSPRPGATGGEDFTRKGAKTKTAWSKLESDLLSKFVAEFGGTATTTPWTVVAAKLNTAMRELPGQQRCATHCERSSKQCRERWIHNLAPHVCKDAWTEEENATLAQAHTMYGNQWSRVARLLPGRTENTVKNHWNATLRRKQPARLTDGSISGLDLYMVVKGFKSYGKELDQVIHAQYEEQCKDPVQHQLLLWRHVSAIAETSGRATPRPENEVPLADAAVGACQPDAAGDATPSSAATLPAQPRQPAGTPEVPVARGASHLSDASVGASSEPPVSAEPGAARTATGPSTVALTVAQPSFDQLSSMTHVPALDHVPHGMLSMAPAVGAGGLAAVTCTTTITQQELQTVLLAAGGAAGAMQAALGMGKPATGIRQGQDATM